MWFLAFEFNGFSVLPIIKKCEFNELNGMLAWWYIVDGGWMVLCEHIEC